MLIQQSSALQCCPSLSLFRISILHAHEKVISTVTAMLSAKRTNNKTAVFANTPEFPADPFPASERY
jgi:hypothetical protein